MFHLSKRSTFAWSFITSCIQNILWNPSDRLSASYNKLDNLNSIFTTHTLEQENLFHKVMLWHWHVCCTHVQLHTHITHSHPHNKIWGSFISQVFLPEKYSRINSHDCQLEEFAYFHRNIHICILKKCNTSLKIKPE